MVTLSDALQAVEVEIAASPASRSYYSISQAAELLGVSRVSIWRWIRAGHLPVVRLGHRTARIRREDLERLPIHIGPSGYRSQVVHEMDADRSPNSEAALEIASEHFVQFYESDEFLLEAVGGFIGPSLRTGDAGIVVATSAHLARLEDVLCARGLDLAAARAQLQQALLRIRVAERRHREGPRHRG